MIKTICHFKDHNGPVAIRTDRIVSIEGKSHEEGSKYTCVTADIVDDEDNCVEYWVEDSVMNAISEWDRQLRAQNS